MRAQFELNFDKSLEVALKLPVHLAQPSEDGIVIIASKYSEGLGDLDKQDATGADVQGNPPKVRPQASPATNRPKSIAES